MRERNIGEIADDDAEFDSLVADSPILFAVYCAAQHAGWDEVKQLRTMVAAMAIEHERLQRDFVARVAAGDPAVVIVKTPGGG